MAVLKSTIVPILSATVALAALAPAVSQARIVRLEITETKPAFGGRNFGEVGVYERVIGKAYGEVDPAPPAERHDPGHRAGAETTPKAWSSIPPTSTSCGRPIAASQTACCSSTSSIAATRAACRCSTPIFPAAPANTGNINALTEAGDGFMQQQGYTMVWFGWQPDVMPRQQPHDDAGAGCAERRWLADHRHRAQRTDRAPRRPRRCAAERLVHAGSKPYPTVSTDNKTPLADGFLPTLTVRVRENEPRVAIPNTEWSFGIVRGRQAGRRERNAALLSGRLQAGPALRADLSRQGPAGARPRLCRGARPRRIPEEPPRRTTPASPIRPMWPAQKRS